MKPLLPAIFPPSEAKNAQWVKNPQGRKLFDHILNVSLSFPSVLLAYSASRGIKNVAGDIVDSLLQSGLNVFIPEHPAPISALSQALGLRAMPLGLYLDETSDGKYKLTAVNCFGGPVDEKELPEVSPAPQKRVGVLGTTDILETYMKRLAGLLDPNTENGQRLSAIETDFFFLKNKLSQMSEFTILFQRDDKGPKAVISSDGQSLTLLWPNGKAVTTVEMVKSIVEYLTKDRVSNGTVVCPEGKQDITAESAETIEIVGDSIDMSHMASFSDLLLGWWEPGIIAHQGNGAFGDAILTLAYLLESWSGSSK